MGEPTSDSSVSAMVSLRTSPSGKHESLEQPLKGALRASDGMNSTGGDGEVALRPATTLGRRIAICRRHHSHFLEAIERRIQRARRRLALRAFSDLTTYRDAVGVPGKAKDGEQDHLLEFTEGGRRGHL